MFYGGKSDFIFSYCYRHEGTEPESVADNLIVTLSSFTGKFVTLHVTKRPGMENVDLLSSDEAATEEGEDDEVEEATEDDSYWESLTGYGTHIRWLPYIGIPLCLKVVW